MKTKWISLVALAWSSVMFNRVEAATNSAANGNRFLFVVETSSASSRLEHGGRQAAFDLIYSGIYGQMRAGDTFGIWTFNENVFAGFYPMRTWSPEINMELAASAGQFLKKQSYDKTGRLSNALKQVVTLAGAVKDVNILVISDPGNAPDDSPVGADYGTTYQRRAVEARPRKKPIITTIVAKNGSVSNWLVTVAGDPIRLPAYAIPEHKQEPANAPIVKAKPEVPRVPRAPIIMKGPTPEQRATVTDESPAPLGKVLSMSTEETRVSSLQTNWPTSTPPERVASVQPGDSSTNGTVAAKAEPPQAVGKIESAATRSALPKEIATTSASKVETTSVPPKAEPREHDASHASMPPKAAPGSISVLPVTKVAAREPQALASPEPQASRVADAPAPVNGESADESSHKPASRNVPATLNAAVTPEPFLSARSMVLVGAGLLLLATILTGLFVQHLRRSASPSFISRSLERHSR